MFDASRKLDKQMKALQEKQKELAQKVLAEQEGEDLASVKEQKLIGRPSIGLRKRKKNNRKTLADAQSSKRRKITDFFFKVINLIIKTHN